MRISLNEIFDVRSIQTDVQANTKEDVFVELIETIASVYPGCDRGAILAAIQEREAKMNTGIASGIAIPHAVCGGIANVIGAIGISQSGIEYGAEDHKPVHVVFMLVLGEKTREKHLRVLNQLSALVRSEAIALIQHARSAEDIRTILDRFR